MSEKESNILLPKNSQILNVAITTYPEELLEGWGEKVAISTDSSPLEVVEDR